MVSAGEDEHLPTRLQENEEEPPDGEAEKSSPAQSSRGLGLKLLRPDKMTGLPAYTSTNEMERLLNVTFTSERCELTRLSKPLPGRCSEGKFSSSARTPGTSSIPGSFSRSRRAAQPSVCGTGPQQKADGLGCGSHGDGRAPFSRERLPGLGMFAEGLAARLGAGLEMELLGSHGEDPLPARNAAQVRGTAGRSRGTLADGAGAFVRLVSHQRNRTIIPLPAETSPQSATASSPLAISPLLGAPGIYPDRGALRRSSLGARWSVVQVEQIWRIQPKMGWRQGGVPVGLEVSPFMQPVKHG